MQFNFCLSTLFPLIKKAVMQLSVKIHSFSFQHNNFPVRLRKTEKIFLNYQQLSIVTQVS
jgi:hypothetical protein